MSKEAAVKEKCTCVQDTTKVLREKFQPEINKRAKVLSWIDEGSFQHRAFSFKGGSTRIAMPFVFAWMQEKKNGQPERNKRQETVMIYPTYCPFCGTMIKTDEQ